MKKYFFSILVLAFAGVVVYSFSASKSKKPRTLSKVTNFHDLSIPTIDGKGTLKMSDYKGKYVLCVNVASECGYTPQYAELQKLSEKYADKLVVIGFPCNQFMGQEPGTAEDIQTFCKKNYGVTFPLSQKISVKGEEQHPIYQWLTMKSLNGVSDATIKWNFNKIMVDPNGNWLKYYGSGVNPLSEEITILIK
ncbi:MAG: glutathione peroxidase [Bacteroidetes bacterium]|jgi:glutathione peroxidase|nr:glutathione peroxidase [Bacteroidota bacterium]